MFNTKEVSIHPWQAAILFLKSAKLLQVPDAVTKVPPETVQLAVLVVDNIQLSTVVSAQTPVKFALSATILKAVSESLSTTS